MNKDQTSTPITDAAAIALHGTRLAHGCIYVKAEDMRNLERQLAEALERLAQTIEQREKWVERFTSAREQRDRLADALSFYADISKYLSPLTGGMGSLYFDCGSIARKSLAAVERIKNEPR